MNMYERKIVLVIFCILFYLQDAGGEEMSNEDLIKVYERSSPGQQVCYYDGSRCTKGQDYCSVKGKTCRSIFPINANEETKLTICADILTKNETEPSVRDTCIYFLGVIESRRVIGNQKESYPNGSLPLPVAGKELCPYPEKYCQRGYEFCNITSRNCERLFPPGVNDSEKRLRCQQVIQNNVTMLWDACIYALGILIFSQPNVPDQKYVEDITPENVWGIAWKVGLVVVLVTVTVLGIGIAAVLFIRHRNLLCFKETPTAPTTQTTNEHLPLMEQPLTPTEQPKPPEGRQSGEDIHKRTEEKRLNVLTEEDERQ